MQTFLPMPNFLESAKCLDYRRLNKQILEAKQIINVLETLEKDSTAKPAWRNHPACRAWKGYIPALKLYHDVMLQEWINRGYNNTRKFYYPSDNTIVIEFPKWLGDPNFHASHRSNLLRKDPVYYGKFGWKEPMDLPYVWPE